MRQGDTPNSHALSVRHGNLSFRFEQGFDQRRHPVQIPRRHRDRSLRHIVIQMPINNGFEYLYRLIQVVSRQNSIPIFLLESLIECNLSMCEAIPNQNFVANRFNFRSRWQDNPGMVSLDQHIQRIAIAKEVFAIG